jgi:hypothetical protein
MAPFLQANAQRASALGTVRLEIFTTGPGFRLECCFGNEQTVGVRLHPRVAHPLLPEGATMIRMPRPALAALIFVLSSALIPQLACAQAVEITTHSIDVPAVHGTAVVTNRPYFATVRTTVVQKLADGTTITKVRTTKEARDSEGRTMRQISLERPNGEPAMLNTSVFDPVNRTQTHWTDSSKTATVMHFSEPQSTPPSRPAGPGSGVGSGGRPVPEAPTLQMRASQEKVEREQLGGKTIAGVYAEGIRFTRTIPEGAEGNDRPMVRVDEAWRSSELQITLFSVDSDPRTGTRTTEYTELDRAEPDPAVFQVPEGYTVKDQAMPVPTVH